MSIYGGMFAGVSALDCQATAFGILSDNIANVNTTGYKGGEAKFSTLVTSASGSNDYEPGGVISRPYVNPEKQGLLTATENETDMSIIGSGFFVVNAKSVPDNTDPYALTRAGSFMADIDGNLRNTAGFYLQGYALDENGDIQNEETKDLLSSLSTVNVSGFTSTANRTTELNLAANLPAEADGGDTYTTNISVFDSLGVDHLLTLNWVKDSADLNTWHATFDLKPNAVLNNPNWDTPGETPFASFADAAGEEGYNIDNDAGVVIDTITDEGWQATLGKFQNVLDQRVTVTFANSGELSSVTMFTDGSAGTVGSTVIDLGAEGIATIQLPGEDGATDLDTDDGGVDVFDVFQTGAGSNSIQLNFGRIGETNGLAQFADDFAVTKVNQNGSGPAARSSIEVSESGLVTALFTNGESKPIYQLAVGTVPAASQLDALSGNAYQVNSSSGDLVLSIPGEGGAGSILSQSLEGSTVDISEEFTSLIVTQRAYSAATKILTTGDEMLDEIIRVKR
ncbi:MAG: flagellar hook protein FlgE [Thalassobaculaceae bacterium]